MLQCCNRTYDYIKYTSWCLVHCWCIIEFFKCFYDVLVLKLFCVRLETFISFLNIIHTSFSVYCVYSSKLSGLCLIHFANNSNSLGEPRFNRHYTVTFFFFFTKIFNEFIFSVIQSNEIDLNSFHHWNMIT